MQACPLGDNIFVAFKEACEAERMDVAQYLLCALEALETPGRPCHALRRAYLLLGADAGRRKPSELA